MDEPEVVDDAVEAFTAPRSVEGESTVEVRDAAKREIDVRLLPWNTTIETVMGAEEFAPGAFRNTPNDGLYLMEPEHGGVQFGLGQDGRPTPKRIPVGRSTRVWEAADGPYATFRVARTAKGDESLALAADGILSGVSAEFSEVPGGTVYVNRDGRRVRRHQLVRGAGAVLTHRPAYGDQAVVLAVRSHEEGEGQMADTPVQEAAAIQPVAPSFDPAPIMSAIESLGSQLGGRLAAVEEQYRSDFQIPGHTTTEPAVSRGRWMQNVLRSLAGERVSELEMRVMADLVTGDNLGVVPEAFSAELIGVIERTRPFLQSTRRVPTPEAGMTLNMPKIVTRPTTGVQVNEKDDIVSTTTSITNVGYDAVTIAGGGDLSLQILRRSSPSYLDLYIELLAEALGENAEDEAVDALLAAGVTAGTGAIDPEALTIGEAWTNARAARQRADTIWLSSAGVEAFIDAKASGTNAPLYASLAADITVAGGARGSISGLRPVYVPTLDDTAVDVLVGPSRGFAWAEDGTYNLQVDVPSKAGRDVALVSIFFFAPIYPAAFTTYSL